MGKQAFGDEFVSEEQYLAMEATSRVRHEYVAGRIFAMAGATQAHNVIAGNIFAFLHPLVKGTPCRAFVSDIKVKIAKLERYYYPDVMVTCENSDNDSVAQESPSLIVEVISPKSESTDMREKYLAYTSIRSLKQYIIVRQDTKKVQVFTRSETGWVTKTLSGDESIVVESIPKSPLLLPLAEVYDGLELPHRDKEEESYEVE